MALRKAGHIFFLGPERLPNLLVAVAAGLSILLIWLALGDLRTGLAFAAMLAGSGAIALLAGRGRARLRGAAMPDRTLLHGLVSQAEGAVVLVDRDGRLVTANPAYEDRFGGLSVPPALGDASVEAALVEAARLAWRDGRARIAALEIDGALLTVEALRCGLGESYMLWRFDAEGLDAQRARAAAFVSGPGGELLGRAGTMAALVDHEGRILAVNALLSERAPMAAGMPADALVVVGEDGLAWLEGQAEPLRFAVLPVEPGEVDGASILLLAPASAPQSVEPAPSPAVPIHFHALLGMMPLGLALVDRDGRLQFMNNWFRSAAGIPGAETPVYPTELVIAEDVAAVTEAVRRAASGQARSADLAVRLSHRPDEPVALTVAPVHGLGDTVVLLSLKDNEEEVRLKRQVAQATKMQAVGQLAGGVAHDFNNILTGILGHCDLMLMRHAPGDSDYDDIQQIKHNANRAAGLTRQLLAFSRQQTLRPQVLQLPDVISEISNLLKRLLGETVLLEVKHGRDLGPVRADPGQLEQVIVNLAVNARDAMPQGGTLTLQTFAVPMAEAARLDNDILPAADYTALSVSDTGMGMAPEIMAKIFEPFFTTKEVGKGTGLGLSTVYGIVKQTGGYIFAESEPGKGTCFTLYFPVHHAAGLPDATVAAPAPERPQELWGSGTILLVEDEAMVRAVAERALSRQGYQVIVATNGEEALEQFDRCTAEGIEIDLLISDVVMPVMDGPTLVGHARQRFPDLPILFMSGYAEEQLRESLAVDNVVFLAKPFSVQQLGEAARAALAQDEQAG